MNQDFPSDKQNPMHKGSYADVLITAPFNQTFDYHIPPGCILTTGSVVRIPFGTRQLFGVVVSIKEASLTPKEKIKDILEVIDWCTLSHQDLKFITWMADYTVTPRGLILKNDAECSTGVSTRKTLASV